MQLSAIALLFFMQADPAAKENNADLRSVLLAREAAMSTYQAEVQKSVGTGADVERLMQARLKHHQWALKNFPDHAEKIQNSIDELLKPRTRRDFVYRHRYAVNEQGMIRAEELSRPVNSSAKNWDRSRVMIFTGNEWQSHFQSFVDGQPRNAGSVTITTDDRGDFSWHELARCAGIPVHLLFTHESSDIAFNLSQRAQALKAIGWRELLENFPETFTREETSLPPEGTEPLPSLILETTPFRDTGKGMYRLQVWFSPVDSFAVKALVISQLHPAGGGAWDFLPDQEVLWSEPVVVDGALPMYQKCHISFFDHVATVNETVSSKEWKNEAYESLTYDFTFSDQREGEELPADLFHLDPAPGANVVDEPRGYRYTVGNAGEELQKTALSERNRRAAAGPVAEPTGSWRRVLLISNIVALLALAAYWIFLRRR